MYGEWIKLDMDEGFQVKVWVSCTPRTPEAEKRARAIAQLKEYVTKQM